MIEIRKYIDTDLESVISAWEAASKIGHPFLSENFINSERKNIPAIYLVTGDVWVAEGDDKVVGFTILHGAEMGALFVSPEFHGEGIGYALMEKAKEIHKVLDVEVFKKNIIGQQFYLKQGFKFIKEYFHKESYEMMLCLKYESKDTSLEK